MHIRICIQHSGISQTLLIIDYLMQWPIYLQELCAHMCLCVCMCVCVWKPTTNKLFTDRVLGISVYMHLGRYCTSAAYIKNNRREQSVTTWPRSVRVPRVMWLHYMYININILQILSGFQNYLFQGEVLVWRVHMDTWRHSSFKSHILYNI